MRATITPSWCSNGWRGWLPDQAAFHSELLRASQSDRAAMGPDAQKHYACNLRAARRRDARFPVRTSSSQVRFCDSVTDNFCVIPPKNFLVMT
jgi:hypothetical protein